MARLEARVVASAPRPDRPVAAELRARAVRPVRWFRRRARCSAPSSVRGRSPQLETTLGRKLAVSHNFYGWTDDFTSWARSTSGSGYIPLVTWEAWTNGVGVSLDDIAAGAHDAMIRSRAQSSASIGQKFFFGGVTR